MPATLAPIAALSGLNAQMGKYQGRAAMGASVAGMGKTLFGYGMA